MNYPKKSYWQNTANPPKYSDNVKDKKFDLLIIGGGMAGLTAAYMLRNSGFKIGIIEASSIGYGTSGFSTAKLTVQHDIIYDYLIKSLGVSEAQKYLQANTEGMDLIKNIIKTNSINCDYKTQTSYVYALTEDELPILDKELQAYKQIGLDGFLTLDTELPFAVKGAIGIENQGQFNPIKYMNGLCRILTDCCCEIYENVRAEDIEIHSKTNTVITNKGNVFADKIIIASHYPFDNDLGMFFLRLYNEKSYILAVKTDDKPFEGMYINHDKPVYSLRYHISDKENILLLGGGKHKVGLKDNEEESYEELECFLKNNFAKYEIIAKWSAQDCMTFDRIPYIGKASDNVNNIYVTSGFNKWGMTTSGAAAIILRNLILNIHDDFSDLFSPQRFLTIESFKELMATGLHTAGGFLKRLSPGSYENISEMKINQGKIINYNGQKVGVYKDEHENYFCINPICTHLKCSLSFNEAETTWDCQCHGSRFDIRGNILEGPATCTLDKIKIKKDDK